MGKSIASPQTKQKAITWAEVLYKDEEDTVALTNNLIEQIRARGYNPNFMLAVFLMDPPHNEPHCE